jgi:hypothetical protein
MGAMNHPSCSSCTSGHCRLCALLLQERALRLRKWANKMQLYEPEIALLESVVRLHRRTCVCDVCLELGIYFGTLVPSMGLP